MTEATVEPGELAFRAALKFVADTYHSQSRFAQVAHADLVKMLRQGSRNGMTATDLAELTGLSRMAVGRAVRKAETT
jgi:DNA invertase Pin-like site-specific DNA recombinase